MRDFKKFCKQKQVYFEIDKSFTSFIVKIDMLNMYPSFRSKNAVASIYPILFIVEANNFRWKINVLLNLIGSRDIHANSLYAHDFNFVFLF